MFRVGIAQFVGASRVKKKGGLDCAILSGFHVPIFGNKETFGTDTISF